jgi:hypothetical protein
VIKSDNGPAFVAEVMQAMLQTQQLGQLFSPAGRPQYNGALERSNRTLKTYTDQQAVAQGHPLRWTSTDLEAARQLANTITRPWGHLNESPEQAWQTRQPISDAEREQFRQTLEIERLRAAQDLGLNPTSDSTTESPADPTVDPTAPLSHADRSRWNRLAISSTLEQLGYVTKRRVRRGPPRAKRPRRNQIERKARAAGIALASTAEADLPATPVAASDACQQESCATKTMVTSASQHDRAENLSAPLALPAPNDILRASLASDVPCASERPAVPPLPSAQREPTATSWWRRPFTLLFLQLKAAIFLG